MTYGSTFRLLMQTAKDALESVFANVRQDAHDISLFRIAVRAGTYKLQIDGEHAYYHLTLDGLDTDNERIADLLDPVLVSIENAGLIGPDPKYPNSNLALGTPEEHEFSHRMNSP